jgi:hypothetical protein
MNKILMALTLLSTGGGGFLAARQSTTLLRHEAQTSREAWLLQTQLIAVAQNDRAALIERVRLLREALAQVPAITENIVWSALQKNHVGQLPPELRERLFEELGFSWNSSEEFVVVSKDTVSDINMRKIQEDGKLTEITATVLALTPSERSLVEATIERAKMDFKDWASTHVERTEPKDDVVAQYSLPSDPAMTLSNNFARGVFEAVGRERADLILTDTPQLMLSLGVFRDQVTHGFFKMPMTIIVKRYLAGNEQRLKWGVFFRTIGTQQDWLYAGLRDLSQASFFPPAFRPIFPNGWADVATREGFELPTQPSQAK